MNTLIVPLVGLAVVFVGLVAADGNAQKLTGESRRELIAVISAAIAETIGTDAAGLRIKSIKKIG